MKKVLAMVLCLMLLMMVIPILIPAEVPAVLAATMEFEGYTGEIISTKGDFEEVTAESLLTAGWYEPEYTIVSDATDAYAGEGYIKVAAGQTVTFTSGNVSEAGYMLRGYYKHLTDGTTADSQIFMQQVNIASCNYNSALVYTNTWTKFGMVINANQFANGTGNIRFSINNGAGCATLCLDNLELIRLDNYDIRNIIQNPGFDVNDVDAETSPQHHYAS